ncbi:hypothetical protein D9758_016494 [Tetrapyrgos nigripes]|uniref:Helicase C-terminal domain-containing protein n=1 Tax=Tetrapyrgos nigripes TaxID=182062 RepID=A0A8H5CK68_9AGAR|nr:hypothetical protein D9758_016494 [Tetrapyrgos nigripes]
MTKMLKVRKGKAIIFSHSTRVVNELASVFEGVCSHADQSTLSPSEQKANEDAWINSDPEHSDYNPWIAASTGLIHGINVGNVQLVMFFGNPYGLMNLFQGGGRARRNWSLALVLLVQLADQSDAQLPMHKLSLFEEYNLFKAGNDLFHTKSCLHAVFSNHFDLEHLHNLACQAQAECSTIPHLTALTEYLDTLKPKPKATTVPSTSYAQGQHIKVTGDDFDIDPKDDDFLPNIEMDVFGNITVTNAVFDSTQAQVQTAELEVEPATVSLPPAIRPAVGHQIKQPHLVNAMTIPLQNARNAQREAAKMKTSKALNSLLQCFKTDCILCWLLHRIRLAVDKPDTSTIHSTPIVVCHGQGKSLDIQDFYMFAGKLQERVDKFVVCLHCWMPQSQYTPEVHPPFKEGESIK